MNIEQYQSYYRSFADYRVDKLKLLQESGVQVYPERFPVTHTLKEAFALPDGTTPVRLAGRVISIRKMGKITFSHLQDVQGKLQFVLKKNTLEDQYDFFHKTVDIGDFLGIEGEMFTTNSGERSVQVANYTFLGKALQIGRAHV